MAKIYSVKKDSRNGRRRKDFDGKLSETFPVVFSNNELVLNMTDGERVFHVILSEVETDLLQQRFAQRISP